MPLQFVKIHEGLIRICDDFPLVSHTCMGGRSDRKVARGTRNC